MTHSVCRDFQSGKFRRYNTIASTSFFSFDQMLYSVGAAISLSMDRSFFSWTPNTYALSHLDQNFLYTVLMCLKSGFFCDSYANGTLLIASARLASATSKRFDALGVSQQLWDEASGLLLCTLPLVDVDHGLGFALVLEGPTVAVSREPWL